MFLDAHVVDPFRGMQDVASSSDVLSDAMKVPSAEFCMICNFECERSVNIFSETLKISLRFHFLANDRFGMRAPFLQKMLGRVFEHKNYARGTESVNILSIVPMRYPRRRSNRDDID